MKSKKVRRVLWYIRREVLRLGLFTGCMFALCLIGIPVLDILMVTPNSRLIIECGSALIFGLVLAAKIYKKA